MNTAKDKHRVIVTTDIGWDPDDQQSLVHLLTYADVLDIEGLIASPNNGNHGLIRLIHETIDAYEKDFPQLRAHSPDYPTPQFLRSVTKQGKLTPGGPFLNGDFQQGKKYWRSEQQDPFIVDQWRHENISVTDETPNREKALCFAGNGERQEVWSNWFDVTAGNEYVVAMAACTLNPTRGCLKAQVRFYGDLMKNVTGAFDIGGGWSETVGKWRREKVAVTAPGGSYKARIFLINERLAAPARGFFTDINVTGNVAALSNAGADLIVRAANKPDPRPLWVVHWGASTDLAVALQKDPSIGSKIKTFSNGPYDVNNGDESMCDFIKYNHPEVLWILCQSSWGGMFHGGHMEDGYDNRSFVANHIKGHGALGEVYPGCGKDKDLLQEGDTPTFLYLLHGDPYDPEGEHWGGSFVGFGEHADSSPNFYQDNPDPEASDHFWGRAWPGAKTVSKWRQDFLTDFAARMDRCL